MTGQMKDRQWPDQSGRDMTSITNGHIVTTNLIVTRLTLEQQEALG